MATTRSSNGAIAFTGSMATDAYDDTKLHGRDNLTAVAARGVPFTTRLNVLTPPNSISPSLPPRGLRLRSSPLQNIPNLDAIESDLEIHNEAAASLDMQGFDASGAITPALLAKHHLPDILLNHGPLVIRHIMGYLTTSVPGFSGIPPAKARRLVVGALEGRGNGGEGGGPDGKVTFEKVGWGRWDARAKGQPPRETRHVSPATSDPSDHAAGMPINNPAARTRGNAPQSWAADSIVFSHSEDVDMPFDEADKMSLDGDESCSSSDVPEDDVMAEDVDEMTDEEDWAAVGAAALRQASFKAASSMPANRRPSVYNSNSFTSPHNGGISKPAPFRYQSFSYHRQPVAQKFNFSALGLATPPSQEQEREAIEALLRLGSV